VDEDGDTPLYTIENIDTAVWLVEHGATVHHRNNDGISVSFIPASVFTSKVDISPPIYSQ
jgi:hypothetical protein